MKKIMITLIVLSFIYLLYSVDYTVSRNPYRIQAGDIDNDGDNDFVIGHISSDTYTTILENIGNGNFQIIQLLIDTDHKLFFKFCDLDENPLKEFLTKNIDGELIIYYNMDFSNPYVYNLGYDKDFGVVSSGDFNGDGNNDIVFGYYEGGQDNLWGFMYNQGNREFSTPQWMTVPVQEEGYSIQDFHCSDLDGNGYDDIIAYTFINTFIFYFDEDGYTMDALNYDTISFGFTAHDFDNDGDDDIVIGHWPSSTFDNFKVYENIGNQQFSQHNYHSNTFKGYCKNADMNCDNLQDVVVISSVYGISSYYNLGNLAFGATVNQMIESYNEDSYEECLADFDGNGTDDLAIIRYGINANNLTILFNNGEGYFMNDPQLDNDNHEISPQNDIKSSNYPNPFNPSTTISYSISDFYINATLEIYNIKGEKIRTFNCQNQNSIIWDGTDSFHNQVSSGIYIYMIKSNDEVLFSKKMTLLK